MKRGYTLLIILFVAALAGCGSQGTSPAPGQDGGYVSTVLDTSYPDALDARSQLALGTMRLEGTAQAVTPQQAAALLPLWQALQGSVTASAEVNAVLGQIEATMHAEQVQAIAAMRLTGADMQDWVREQGPGAPTGPGGPGGAGGGIQGMGAAGGDAPPDMATRQAQFSSMSQEERAALRATAEAAGISPGFRSGSPAQPALWLGPLIALLQERAAEGAPSSTPAPPAPAAQTPTPTPTPPSTPTPADPSSTAAVSVAAAVASAAPLAQPSTAGQPPTAGAAAPEMERLPDTDPGPPLSIWVDTIRITESGNYELLGRVRNEGAETYEGIGVVATFYVEQQCGDRFLTMGPPGQPSGGTVEYVCDPNWYGPVAVHCPCPFLKPGAECPFSLEIYGRDYVAYALHPLGQPIQQFVWRQEASLVLSDVRISRDELGAVRIKGVATNENTFTVRNVTVAGTLLDSAGNIVSVGSTVVLGEVAPGGSVSFDLRLDYTPYADYTLYAQATQV